MKGYVHIEHCTRATVSIPPEDKNSCNNHSHITKAKLETPRSKKKDCRRGKPVEQAKSKKPGMSTQESQNIYTYTQTETCKEIHIQAYRKNTPIYIIRYTQKVRHIHI